MAAPHKPCWDGWESGDMVSYDDVWRVDFRLHCFTNGKLSCSVLPVCTADGKEIGATSAEPAAGVQGLLTVIITSSPVRSNPSTRMLRECIASLDRNAGLSKCRKLIMCDGFKVRQRSLRKQGVVTDEEAELYCTYVRNVARLCREDPAFRRTRLVRLARRQGSAYAIREALEAHVRTPFVLIIPHDCVIARPLKLADLVAAMHGQPERIRYVKLPGRSTAHYADAVHAQYGVRLRPSMDILPGATLTPMLRYMDNAAVVSVGYLREKVFVPGSGVRRGTFIEDTYGKQTQMHEWLQSAAFSDKLPPPCNGCFLLSDGDAEPMMRHLDGKTYLDPEQRKAAGLPAYPTDWTASLQEGGEALADVTADVTAGSTTQHSSSLLPPVPVPVAAGGLESGCSSKCGEEICSLRDCLCWSSLADGCSEQGCGKLHPRHQGSAVCGRHATSLLELWGRRKRPDCLGDCGKAHPTLAELEAALGRAMPSGSRLHVHTQTAPNFAVGDSQGSTAQGATAHGSTGNGSTRAGGTRSHYVVPSELTLAAAEVALDARAPMPLRVAIDAGYDELMSEGERKSLATQCGLCHGIASQAEHRPHVALAICCGAAEGGGQGGGRGAGPPPTFDLLCAAGLEQWRPLAWQAADGTPLSVLAMPGAAAGQLVYLSPEAPEVLSELRRSEVYIIGGLVDRHKKHGASLRRATALGIRCARLPLLENLPAEMRGRSNALDALNLNSAFRLLVEWSKTREWTSAIATAFDGTQRSCCPSAGLISPTGYWDGPKIAHQHQHDAALSEALLAFFKAEGARSIVDLGCGVGSYVRHFLGCGLATSGFDGNPATPQLSKGTCAVLDLSTVADVAAPRDWVLSLEVGEHLPRAHEGAFMENLHRHNSRGMVLSWALKGQGGTGHVNEQDNDYIKAKICAKGYVNDLDAEQALRAAAAFPYFKRTIMVFRK